MADLVYLIFVAMAASAVWLVVVAVLYRFARPWDRWSLNVHGFGRLWFAIPVRAPRGFRGDGWQRGSPVALYLRPSLYGRVGSYGLVLGSVPSRYKQGKVYVERP